MTLASSLPLDAGVAPASVADGWLPLTHWGLIQAQGADAASFLHGQLTNDFALLGASQARLAGYCSPKGRLLATFIGMKPEAHTVQLVCSADLLAPTLKRLSMYVLRADCKLSDASAQARLLGIAGPAASRLARHALLAAETWSLATLPGQPEARLVRLPPAQDDAGQPIERLLLLAPADPLPEVLAEVPRLELDRWQWLEVRSGVAMLTAPLVDQLVPQMLNLESVGGVSFKKGCYPGQEVVARSQFRGTLKRRTYRLALPQADAAPQVGQEVFHSADAEQPCGLVVAAAAAPQGGWELLAALQIAATESGSLHLREPGGPLLSLQTLPYALLQDI